jgi:ribosomal protein S18 acetylase RimI-like enzyme
MKIRKATLEDSSTIATFSLLAMEEIVYKFICKNDYQTAKEFLLYFIRKENNQYSYQNCFIAEINEANENDKTESIAFVCLYDGAKLETLRKPIIEYVKANFNQNFTPENETQKGEIYIDCFAVLPNYQGKGIGTELLQLLIEEYVNNRKQTLGLLVETENTNAQNLYSKVGFKSVGNKTLMGKKMNHLQITIF